jgi:hypothetical protein
MRSYNDFSNLPYCSVARDHTVVSFLSEATHMFAQAAPGLVLAAYGKWASYMSVWVLYERNSGRTIILAEQNDCNIRDDLKLKSRR